MSDRATNEAALSPNRPANFTLSDGPVLLYDGECGVCSASVQWILNHERSDTLRFAALQSDLGQSLRQEAGIDKEIDSVIWIEDKEGQVLGSMWSTGVVRALRYVGGPWSLLSSFAIIPRPLRDAAYRLFARHRQKFAPTQCLLPPPETRARFLNS